MCLSVLACTPPTPAEQTPARTVTNPTASSTAPAACARPLTALRAVSASLDLLPHHIADQIIFGLDGAFVATSGSYPLGAGRHWWELDAAGVTIRQLDIPQGYGRVSQSLDGTQFIFTALVATTGGLVTYVRDTAGGATRVLAVGELAWESWIDADSVLLEWRDTPGVFHAIQTRSLVDTTVFRPTAPPTVAASGDTDSFSLSGDLRWAIIDRYHGDGSFARADLYDVRSQTYVPAALPRAESWLAPRGDVLVWIDGTQLLAMHLCDRRVVTIATLPKIATVTEGGAHWSSDGRYLSFAYGRTDELTAPERVIVLDLDHGTIADIAAPWGFVRQWSPGLDVVVLSRNGYHTSVDRLARFSMP